MAGALPIAIAQVDCFVGDAPGNADRILAAAARARALGARIVVFPELALSGYPPEDLLFHRGFRNRIGEALARLEREARGIDLVVGYPEYAGEAIYNSAAVIRDGRIVANHRKQLLPNYQVFDEKRYFQAGGGPTCLDVDGVRVALLICEDVWEPGPAAAAKAAGAELALVLNASPFELRKQSRREEVLLARARETGLGFVYANLVGGQDELVFDGQSFVMSRDGVVAHRAPAFDEAVTVVEHAGGRWRGELARAPTDEEAAYRAIATGIRDYVNKHGFPGVVIGLSGGVDSALVLVLAVDALGADRVHTVMMPSRYTSPMSLEDAEAMARGLGVKHSILPIEAMFEATLETLAAEFRGLPPDATEENIQARCRGMLLMAISNKTGRIVLTTGNKSEMSVGYATLYGDMAGGFAPIKDCSKTLVYRLCRWRNAQGVIIPPRIIERPPSAELRPDQKDTDSLPPYEVLDPILEAFVEQDLSVGEIVGQGFDRATVVRVLEMVKRNEYKRRQAPPGVRVSRRAFGRDWRYPITSGYRPGDH
ncbi:MAG: NAD+ synthase [Steroidobacteraceae bacterium]|jgi:NAD+ synthase (glutamine-hydrolysing)|nr:NAD+ synthase [Steroidobacteraceae bacterium]